MVIVIMSPKARTDTDAEYQPSSDSDSSSSALDGESGSDVDEGTSSKSPPPKPRKATEQSKGDQGSNAAKASSAATALTTANPEQAKTAKGKRNKSDNPMESCGIPGMPYDAKVARRLDEYGRHLAHYFGLRASSNGRTEKEWTKGQLACILEATIKIFNDPAVVKHVQGPMRPSFADTKAGRAGLSVNNFVGVVTAWHAVRLMRAKPAFFAHTKLGPGAGVGTHVDVNNALHAWKVLLFLKREKQGNRLSSWRMKEDLAVPMRRHVPVGAALTQAGSSGSNPVDNCLRSFEEVFGLPLAEASRLQEAFENGNQDRTDGMDGDQELTWLEALVEEVSGPPIGLGERLTVVNILTSGPDKFLTKCVKADPLEQPPSVLADLPGLNEATAQGDALAATLDGEGEVRLSMQGNTARAPSLHDACTTLGVDPTTFELPLGEDQAPVGLKLYQVSGVAWMIGQEKGHICGGILVDDCGLGKTLQALSLVYCRGRNRLSSSGRYKPTLIVAPTTVIPVWIAEATR
ncbi:hypothetical protein BJX64DRAFT_295560 [Aspergillus heterothallicus]